MNIRDNHCFAKPERTYSLVAATPKNMSEPTPKEPRGPTNLRIKFRSASLDQFIERYAADVSRGGIFIRTREPLAVNTRLKLEFQLQDGSPLLSGEGTVVWIREHDQTRENVTPGMGVRFDKLSPDSQPTLERILTEKTRLEQAGLAAAGQAKSGGMAVRRPSGVFANLDASARAALGPPGGPGATGPEATPIAVPPAPAVPPPAVPKTAFPASGPAAAARGGVPAAPASSTPSGPFSRARATGTRPVPVPSALFEPPTAADIDKALEALQEAPGPAPAARPTPAAPRYVSDDASNEPTRVADVVDELVGGAGTRAPLSGSAPLTERLAASGTAPPDAAEENPPPLEDAAAPVDGSIEIQDVDVIPAVPEPEAEVQAPVPPEPSKRFRAASKAYPTLQARGRGLKVSLAVVAVLVVAAVATLKLHLLDRFIPQLRAPVPVVATPAPSPAPAPAANAPAANAPAANAPAVNAPPANTAPPTPEGAGGSAAVAAAPPEKPADEKPAAAKPAAEKPAAPPEEKKPEAAAVAPETHVGKHHPHHHAEAEAKPPAAPAAEKPAAAAPAPDKPVAENAAPDKPAADKPAGDQPAAEKAAAPPAPDKPAAAAAPTPAAPVMKITSTPSGAEVLIDGKEVGVTPFLSKDVDPASPHAITIKKDGYEPSERMVSGLDWSRPHGNNPQTLKVNAKLRRSAAAPAAASPAAPKEGGEQKDNAQPDDTGGPYIKEIKPDSP